MRIEFAKGTRIDLQEMTLRNLKMTGDIDLDGNKLKTTNLLIKEATPGALAIRNRDDTEDRNLYLNILGWHELIRCYDPVGKIQTNNASTAELHIQSHDGTDYVTNLRFVGGKVEIYGGKLTGDLDAGGYGLWNIPHITGRTGDYTLNIRGYRTADYAGDAINIVTKDSANANKNRIVITGGVDVADIKIRNSNMDLGGGLFKNAKIVCVSKGLTAVTVTETTSTLKQTLAPDSGYYGFSYVEGIHITANNPSGSGVTLYFQTKAYLDDGTEVALHTEQSVVEGGSFDDWLRWFYDSIPNGKMVREIRLYAYCSATPASGYEPTVNIEKVTGMMV